MAWRFLSGRSLASVLMLLVAALAAPQLMQSDDGIEQRVAGLEARVTVLEGEVATLQSGAVATPVIETHTITGTITLIQDFDRNVVFREASGYCSGTGGYDDLYTGTNVVILDGSGNTLATTQLVTAERYIDAGGIGNICEFGFTVDVPDASFYTIEISHRGGPTYSLAEMEASDWTMDLSISS